VADLISFIMEDWRISSIKGSRAQDRQHTGRVDGTRWHRSPINWRKERYVGGAAMFLKLFKGNPDQAEPDVAG